MNKALSGFPCGAATGVAFNMHVVNEASRQQVTSDSCQVQTLDRTAQFFTAVQTLGRTAQFFTAVQTLGRTAQFFTAVQTLGRTAQFFTAVQTFGRTAQFFTAAFATFSKALDLSFLQNSRQTAVPTHPLLNGHQRFFAGGKADRARS